MSLRAILSGSRAKKRSAPAAAAPSSKKRKTTTTSTTAARTTPWPAGAALRQTKPGGGSQYEEKGAGRPRGDDTEEDYFDDDDDQYPLHDTGLATLLADDLSLRDVVQALRSARGGMFDLLPQQQRAAAAVPADGAGVADDADDGRSTLYVGNSTRVAELLHMRRRMPPLATTAHVAALLPNATATERETAALVRAGVLRRVVQPQWRRGVGGGGGGRGKDKGRKDDAALRRALALGTESLGEVLIETAALQQLVQDSSLGEDAKRAFRSWLAGEDGEPPVASTASRFTINGQPAPQLADRHMVDDLVRAGFLVGQGSAAAAAAAAVAGGGGGGGLRARHPGDVFARPEDRTSMLSLETVARAASGSFAAVGGVGAVYTAGGGGGGTRGRRATGATVPPPEDLLLAVPGHGLFVKLVSGALAHLAGLLARTPFRETLESTLRERWNSGGEDGGGPFGANSSNTGKRPPRSRTSHPGWLRRVPASRTRKWKDFYGLRFEWVLAEALGAGLVELFNTGSVGRGVRLLS